MGIANWNKVIDIYFINKNGATIGAIKCPKNGRKPNITLVGAMYGKDIAHEFDITIKNFYLDEVLSGTKKLRVYAGYEDKRRIAFEGSLMYMHQESPGPESTTVVHGISTDEIDWLTNTVSINLNKGYTLQAALTQISQALGYKSPKISPSVTQISSDSFQFSGTCRQALVQLKKSFDGIDIEDEGGVFAAYTKGETKQRIEHDIPYLSAPPKIEAGAKNMLSAATISAPWNPLLRTGNIVTFNSACYQSTQYLKTLKQTRAKIQIASLQFHFGTTTSVNQMTIYGTVATYGQ